MDMMQREEIVMLCISDYGGQVRGKGFPLVELESRLKTGIGLAPTNLMITAFSEIADSPWGPRGELIMMADPATETRIEFSDERPAEHFFLCDLLELDGTPWACCPRRWLRAGLEALSSEFALSLYAAFEHEFHLSGARGRAGDAYALDAMRLQSPFGECLLAAMRASGIEPETFLPEYGPQQFEITCKPALGLEAACAAVRLREITRAVARWLGEKACFAPVMVPGQVGNGVHIHFSLQDAAGRNVSYDAGRPGGVSELAGRFAAGILQHMPALVALSAPSLVSYERLQPNRWSASYNNLGDKDREAGLRLCPLDQRPGRDPWAQFNLEYRAGDAAASPYLALGALVWAGLQGLRDKLAMPAPTTSDPGAMSDEERAERGIVRLPQSLAQALDALQQDTAVRRWMGEEFLDAYLVHKQSEIKIAGAETLEEQCARYVDAY